MKTEPHKKLGEILLGLGVIDSVKLTAALNDQKSYGGRLGFHLARMGFVPEQKLVEVLSNQLKIPKINLQRSHIRIDALSAVKKDVCRKYGLIPVARKMKGSVVHLLIAMADPTDIEAIGAVEFSGNCRVTVAIAPESDINRAVEYCYTESGLRECIGAENLSVGIPIDLNADEKDEFVLITADDENVSPMMRYNVDPTIRGLIDLLVRKKIITREEALELVRQQAK